MPDMGEAYGDQNVPTDPYAQGLQEAYGADVTAEPEVEDNPDPEYDTDPLAGLTVDEATFLAASDFIAALAPGVSGLGLQVVNLQRILKAWYQQGREDATANK